MRSRIRCLAVLAAVMLLLSNAQASGFAFDNIAEESLPSAPAYLFDLEAAQALKKLPVFQVSYETDQLILTCSDSLLDGCAAAFAIADGAKIAAEIHGQTLTLRQPPEICWLTLSWKESGAALTAQYLIRASGRCEVWNAAADDGQYYIIRKNSGNTYSLSCELENVKSTTLYYNAEGRLISCVMLGDHRGNAPLPLTLQYNPYGCAVSITAADLQHTYTYSRPQAAWHDEAGKPARNEQLPAFDPAEHPSPAARKLTIGAIHRSEKKAGIDRAALLAAAPTLSELSITEGTVSFLSDADSASLTVDRDTYYATAQSTLRHEEAAFVAESADIYIDSRTEITLERGSMTAVYQASTFMRLTDSAKGITLTADGILTYETDAVTAVYNARGNLTEARIHSADGALLTYNRQGRLIGWAMDEYSWNKDSGWRTTAVNEKGNIIHPAVKQPAAVNLKNYPAITTEE